MPRQYTRRSNEDRFWSHVAFPATPGACWTWQAATANGYGTFSFCNPDTGAWRQMTAHRFAWLSVCGPLTNQQEVRHVVCRNRLCVRFSHLKPGTHRENQQDMVADGMSQRGDKHWTRRKPDSAMRGETHALARLSEADVREMRALWATGQWTLDALAERYPVSRSQVHLIVTRQRWKHVA